MQSTSADELSFNALRLRFSISFLKPSLFNHRIKAQFFWAFGVEAIFLHCFVQRAHCAWRCQSHKSVLYNLIDATCCYKSSMQRLHSFICISPTNSFGPQLKKTRIRIEKEKSSEPLNNQSYLNLIQKKNPFFFPTIFLNSGCILIDQHEIVSFTTTNRK